MSASQAAINLIINYEVSSQTQYEKLYRWPTWPEGQSGVTVGIGYDCGYVSTSELHDDWRGRISDDAIADLDTVVGLRGQPAQLAAHRLRATVDIPWQVAVDEFNQREVPKYSQLMDNALHNTDLLSPDAYGALLSLTYNRGAAYAAQDARHTEMRNIAGFMTAKLFTRIPYEIRSMKRLWPTVKGLRDRREAEAQLFEAGLTAMGNIT